MMIKERNPAAPDMTLLLKEVKDDIFKNMNCHQIGVIEEFFPANQTATVRFVLKQIQNVSPDGTVTIVEHPLLKQVPVMMLYGGGSYLTMPIAPGEIKTAEVIFYGEIASGGSDAVRTQTVWQFTRQAFTVDASKTALNAAMTYTNPTGTQIVDRFLQAVNAAYTMTSLTIRWVDDALDPPVLFSVNQPGAVAGDRLPSETAAYLLLKTGLKGRSYKGGKHIGPLSEADIGDDVLLSGALTKLANLVTSAMTITDASPNTWKLVVMPRMGPNSQQQFLINPTTVATYPVTQVLTRQNVGYMKSRKVRSVY